MTASDQTIGEIVVEMAAHLREEEEVLFPAVRRAAASHLLG